MAIGGSNKDFRPDERSALVNRNVNVHGHRTSVRLEPQMWDSMTEICRREFCTPHDVCSYVAERKPTHDSLTSSLRIFILDYFRNSSTEDGHFRAGHGQSMFMSQQQDRWMMRDIRTRRVRASGRIEAKSAGNKLDDREFVGS